MLDKDYNYKINLRNKFYKKTIDKFVKINKSLELLNKYNKEIYNQLGGDFDSLFSDLTTQSRATADAIEAKSRQRDRVIVPVDIKQETDRIIQEIILYLNQENVQTVQKTANTAAAIDSFKTKLKELDAVSSRNTKIVTGIQDLNNNILKLSTAKPPVPSVPSLPLNVSPSSRMNAWGEPDPGLQLQSLSPRDVDTSSSPRSAPPSPLASPSSSQFSKADFPPLAAKPAQGSTVKGKGAAAKPPQ